MIISNIIVTILFGGTAQTSGDATVAILIPESARVRLGAVLAAVYILVPVPGQAQVVREVFQ